VKIKRQRDFFAGLMFIALGLGFATMALEHRMGTAARMGPGYFPFALGVLLALLGAVVLIGAIRGRAGADDIGGWDIRSLVCVIGSVAMFGVALQPLGLVLSLLLLVVASSLASREFSLGATLVSATVLALVSTVLFVYGLKLQFPIWPAAFGG
jgi:hypothetical protein